MADRTDTASRVMTGGWVVFAATMTLIAGVMSIPLISGSAVHAGEVAGG